MDAQILVVDDEKPIRRFMQIALEAQGYRYLEAESGTMALTMVASHLPDVLILDLGLPDMDGLDVIKRLRGWSKLPIIVVSARGHEREKVVALDAGADDYLIKPFGIAELLARIRVALRREIGQASAEEALATFWVADLSLDFVRRKVQLAGEEVHLTPTEYDLLTMLARHAGRVLTHRTILQSVWGSSLPCDVQSLRVCMANLRRKLEQNPAEPRYLLTEVGVGYRLVDE